MPVIGFSAISAAAVLDAQATDVLEGEAIWLWLSKTVTLGLLCHM